MTTDGDRTDYLASVSLTAHLERASSDQADARGGAGGGRWR
jgi:hypothetical protein